MRDATLLPVPVDEIRPTQITLAFHEIAQKREQWRKHLGNDRKAFLSRHTVPTVLGPKKRHYLIDGHHLVRAIADEGMDDMMVSVVADLSALRRAGGFAKDPTSFAEFLWADFLRRRIGKPAWQEDFADAIVEALGLARSEHANYLPGWCGPDPIEP